MAADEFVLEENPQAVASEIPAVGVSLTMPALEKAQRIAKENNYTLRQLIKEVLQQSLQAVEKGDKK